MIVVAVDEVIVVAAFAVAVMIGGAFKVSRCRGRFEGSVSHTSNSLCCNSSSFVSPSKPTDASAVALVVVFVVAAPPATANIDKTATTIVIDTSGNVILLFLARSIVLLLLLLLFTGSRVL